MELYCNQRKINLTQRDFKGQGGQGSVYIQKGVAYKVYTDPTKALPAGKIRELAALTDPNVIKPEDPLLDPTGQLVGYTMKAIADGEPLCLSFNKSYRDKHNLTNDRMLALVQRLRELVAHIHTRRILVVDLNEMNFLLSDDLTTVYAIDVDSYQTPTYPASAIMDTIRDRHNATFSEGTDWFSFAVVSFQMFIGIHPYRGKHATLKTLEERMLANVSALNPSVALPAVCQPLTVVPQAYRDWYEAVLERGQRVPAPDGPVTSFTLSPTAAPTLTPTSGNLQINRVAVYGGAILEAVGDYILTTEGVYHGSRRLGDVPAGTVVHLAITPGGTPLLAWREKGELRLRDVRRAVPIPVIARADALMTTEGRLYLRQGGQLLEVHFVETPAKIFAQPQVAGTLLEQATLLFPGGALQDLLGAKYLSLLPESGVCHQIHVPEWDGWRVVDARFEGGVVVAVAERNGVFARFLLRFARDYRSYDVEREDDIETTEINFITLPSGVVLRLTERDTGPTLDVFAARKGDTARKAVADPTLTGDCRLLKNALQARLACGETLYDIRMV